jgi:hypothetical protein
MLEESGLVTPKRIAILRKETNEILSIVVSSIKTLRAKQP